MPRSASKEGGVVRASEQAELEGIVFKSTLLLPILRAWREIALPDCWLVAGAVAQTVWNHAFGLPLTHGISDVDIVYFDADDLSEESEANQAARVRDMFSDLPAWIDVKYEARVHCWYEAKFGYTWRSTNPELTKRYFRERPGDERTHIHVRRSGSWHEQWALLFRDYMRGHVDEHAPYVALKAVLAERHGADRTAYTNGKDDFFWDVIRRADRWAAATGWEPQATDA